MRAVRTLVLLIVLSAACALRGLAQDPMPLATSSSPDAVSLRPGKTEVRLVPVQDDRRRGERPSIASRLRGVVAGHQVYLNLTEVKAEDPPGVTYNVYVNLPPDRPPAGTSDPHYVGTFSFFNALSSRPTAVAINITPHVERLLSIAEIGDDLRVAIIPSGGTANLAAAPQIGKVLLTVR
jgi:hypothetical protein